MNSYKQPIYYTPEQQQLVEDYILSQFGGSEAGYTAHEVSSEYVHSDVQIFTGENGYTTLVTCGPGARKMEAPDDSLARIELVMVTSRALPLPELSILTSELVSLSKFPFRRRTWLGHGHTICATSEFANQFGYTHFILASIIPPIALPDQDQVNFLLVVPIYERERDWLMEHNTAAFFNRYSDVVDEAGVFCVDLPRDPIV